MKYWPREPLIYFLVLGAALFVLHGLVSDRSDATTGGEILVSQGQVENLVALFTRTRRRPPTPAEIEGLVRDHVLEEALYREGVALGLDANDVIVRRRIRQKMEFVLDDVAERAIPTEEELEAFVADNAESYRLPPRYSFRQIYLNPDRRGESLRTDAATMLATLRDDPAAAADGGLGDLLLLDDDFERVDAKRVERDFGASFAAALAKLPVGEWSGPVRSAFGIHLVIVDERTEPRDPTFPEVRRDAERDWRLAQREQGRERYRAELLARFQVAIDWPPGLAGAPPDGDEP